MIPEPHTEDSEAQTQLPVAPADDDSEDDGIFMSWPGGDVPPEDNGEAEDPDEKEPNREIKEEQKRSKKEKKKKKKRGKDRNTEETDPETQEKKEPYAFEKAAQSDEEESFHTAPHDAADNEEVLSSVKYMRHTQKLSDRLLRRVLPIVLVCLFVTGFLLFFFRLQHLTFDNLTGYPPEEVFDAIGLKKNMFLFSVKEHEIEHRLHTKFPYIEKVDVDLDLPDTVHLCFTEDCALFYTKMYDEYFIISESMRVLSRFSSPDEVPQDLRSVDLSSVSYAVVGHPLAFFDASYIDFLTEFLSVLEHSAVYPHISAMDLSNRFSIRLLYEDRLTIDLGTSEDLDTKLLFVKSIVEALDPDDSGTVTLIDNKKATFSPTPNMETGRTGGLHS